MLKTIRLYFTLFLLCGILSACDQKEEATKTELKRITKDLNRTLDIIVDRLKKTDLFVENLLNNTDLATISTDGMDREYKLYAGNLYYRTRGDKPENPGSIYSLGTVPINETVKRRLKLLEKVLPELKKNVESTKYGLFSWYLRGDGETATYPYFNSTSVLPVGMDMKKFHWMYLTDDKHNPKREIKFIEPPFVAIADQGLILPVNSPVYVNNQWTGHVSIDIQINSIEKELFKKNPYPLLLITGDTLLLAISPKAKNILKMSPYKRQEIWLEQAGENLFLGDNLKLSKNSSREIKELARKFKTEGDRFKTRISGKNYTVLKEKLNRVDFHILALIEE